MKETYSINELAMITSLTTRTLRNYLSQGALTGEKIDGAWAFTAKDIDHFMSNEAVRKRIQANHNAVVFDFLSDSYKRSNRTCVILDLAVDIAEAANTTRFFCEQANQSRDVELRVAQHRGLTRVILSGDEETVINIMERYRAL